MRQLLRNYFSSLNAFLPGKKHRRSRRASSFRDVNLVSMDPLENRCLLTFEFTSPHLLVDTGTADNITADATVTGTVVLPSSDDVSFMGVNYWGQSPAGNFSNTATTPNASGGVLTIPFAAPTITHGAVQISFRPFGTVPGTSTVVHGTTTSVSFTYVPPLRIDPLGPLSSWEGNPIGGNGQGVQVTAHDELGLNVTFSANGLPEGLSINTQTGLITGTPPNTAYQNAPMHDGVYHVVINASDTASNLASINFDFTIFDRNPLTVTNPGPLTNAEGDDVSRPIMATSPQNLPITFSAPILPEGLTINPTTGNITPKVTWTAYERAVGAHGVYHVTIDASDASGATGSTSFDWNITSKSPITVMDPGFQSSWEGNPLGHPGNGMPIMASHEENLPLTFSITGQPEGVSINPSNGVITGTPSSTAWNVRPPNGDYAVVVRATDATGQFGERQFTLRIFDRNPIMIQNPGTIESFMGESVTRTIDITDPQNLPFQAMVTNLPTGLTSDMQGHITGTVSAPVGSVFTVTVRASDASGATDPDPGTTFEWHIVPPRPTINLANQTIREGETLDVTPSWSIPPYLPPGSQTFSAYGLPNWLQINSTTGRITTTAGGVPFGAVHGGNQGSYTFSVTIDDHEPMNNTATDSVTIQVLHVFPLLTQPANRNDDEEVPLSLNVIATDPDGDPITYGASGLPTGLSINTTTGVISGQINYGQFTGNSLTSPTVYPVTVTAKAGIHPLTATSLKTFNWGVWHADPAITAIADQSSLEQEAVSLPVTVSSPDGSQYTISSVVVSGLPAGLTYHSGTHAIQGTLSGASSGNHTVTITATDNLGASSQKQFQWSVTDVNRPPVFPNLSDRQDDEHDSIVVGVSATDPDLDPLTYSMTGAPSGLSINASTGTISGTISWTAGGTNQVDYQVTVQASDGHGHTATGNFTWTVRDVHRNPVITVVNDRTDDEGDNVSLTVHATCPDGSPYHITQFYPIQVPAGLTFDPETGVLSGTLTYQSAGTYTSSFYALDSAGYGSQEDFVWTVNNVNGPPTIPALANRSDHLTATVSFSVGASDPDADTLTYSTSSVLPVGISLNSNTGDFSGTIDVTALQYQNGIYPVQVNVSDGHGHTATRGFTWTVYHRPPVISNIANRTNVENDEVSLTFSATCPDGAPYTISSISVSGRPTDLVYDADTHTLSGQLGYNTAGTYTVTVTATDDAEATGSDTFVWTVTNLNGPPTITDLPSRSSPENFEVNMGVFAQDPDADTLSYSVTGTLPPGVSFDPQSHLFTGTIGWNAAQVQGGVYPIEVTVSDGHNHTATDEFTWTITDVHRPPTVVATADRNDDENDLIDLSFSASCPDGAPYTISSISVSGASAGLVYNAETRTLSGRLGYNTAGTYNVTVTATDNTGATGSDTFVWTVTNLNAPPTITDLPSRTTPENFEVDMGVFAQDPDSDPLSYSVTGTLPPGVSFNPQTHLFTGTIDWDAAQVQGGVYQVAVSVSDGHNHTATDEFTWTITDVHRPPTIVATPDREDDENDLINLSFSASCPDGAPYTISSISVSGAPTDLTYNPGTRVLSGRLGYHAAGTYSVTVTAVDSVGASSTDTFEWTIVNVNGPPELGEASDREDREGLAITPFTIGATDPDNDALSYSISGAPAGITIHPETGTIGGTAEFGAANAQDGVYTVVVTVSDGHDHTDSGSFEWTFIHQPIVITPPVEQWVKEGQHVVLQVGATDPNVANQDDIELTWENAPAGLTMDSDGHISGWVSPGAVDAGDEGHPGRYTITVRGDDGHVGSEASATFVIHVGPHDPLVFATTTIAQLTEGQLIPVGQHVLATDPNPDPDPDAPAIRYSSTNFPWWAGVNSSTGAIVGAPPLGAAQAGQHTDLANPEHPTDPGKYPVTVWAHNVYTGSLSSTSFTIEVGFAAARITQPPSQVSEDGDTLSASVNPLVIQADVPNGDPALVTVVDGELPSGLFINPETHVISGQISNTASYGGDPLNPGHYTATLRSHNAYNRGEDAFTTIHWTVLVPPPEVMPIADRHDLEETNISQIVYFHSINPLVELTVEVEGLPEGQWADFNTTQAGPLPAGSFPPSAFPPGTSYEKGYQGTISGIFHYGAAELGTPLGVFPVAVTVRDNHDHVVSTSFLWKADAPPPTLDEMDDQDNKEHDTVSFFVPAHELDPYNTLHYAATGLPRGLNINTSTGEISGTIDWDTAFDSPEEDGHYTIDVTVTDLHNQSVEGSFEWNVTNYPPELDDVDGDPTDSDLDPVVYRIHDSVELQITATAPNPHDPPNFTFSAVGLPASLHMDSSGQITGTLTYADALGTNAGLAGTYHVTVTVDDHEPANNTDTESFTLIVKHVPPVLNQPRNQTHHEHELVQYSISASQRDGDPLTFSWTNAPPGLQLNSSTGAISGSADYGDSNHIDPDDPTHPGRYHVTATVSNGFGDSNAKQFWWTILHSPPIIEQIDDQDDIEGVWPDLTIGATSPDGDHPLTYVAGNLPSGLTIDLHSGTILGYIHNDAAELGDDGNGTYLVHVTVTDQHGMSDEETFTWRVIDPNQRPTLDPIADQAHAEGHVIVLPTFGHDPENDPLHYSAQDLPDGLDIDPDTGVISGLIEDTAAEGGNTGIPGEYRVTVTVDDGDLSAEQQFSWIVIDGGTIDGELDKKKLDLNSRVSMDGCTCILMNPTSVIKNGNITATVRDGNIAYRPYSAIAAPTGDVPEPPSPNPQTPSDQGELDVPRDSQLEENIPRYDTSSNGLILVGVFVTLEEALPEVIEAQVTFNNVQQAVQSFTVTAEMVSGKYRLALPVNVTQFDSGHYDYSVKLTAKWNVGDPNLSYNYEMTLSESTEIVNRSQSQFGKGWSPPALDTLAINEDGATHVRGNNTAVWHEGLTPNASGGYTVTEINGTVLNFDASGRLLSRVALDGDIMTYTYGASGLSQVTEPDGRTFTYTYDGFGRLSSIADSETGRTTGFQMDAQGNLQSITWMPFGGQGGMGQTPSAWFTYDSAGRMTAIVDATGATSIAYSADGTAQTVTNPDGSHWTLDVWEHQGYESFIPQAFVLTTYRDELGRVTYYISDEDGFTTSVTDSSMNETRFAYSNGEISQEVQYAGIPNRVFTPPHLATSYGYDSRGRQTTIGYPDGTREYWYYNGLHPAWGPVTYVDQMGKRTEYTYDEQGHLLSETDPLGRTRFYSYESHGWMTSSADWSQVVGQPGPVTYYEYDFKGHLTRTVYPDGTSTAATYDAAGNLLTETDQLGRVTTYTYDGFGRMLTMTAPAPWGGPGATTSYTYDAAGRLLTETAADGMTSYTYDWRGNVTGVTRNGTITKYLYNAAGLLRSQSNAQHQTWYYAYDPSDNLLKTIGPVATTYAEELTGIPGPAAAVAPTTEFQYDGFNRQTQTIDALDNVTEFAYDDMGRVTAITDPAGHVTSYEYDRNGRQVRVTQPSPDGAAPELVSIWQFDAAGQLVSTIDPLGNVTRTLYDDAGNVKQKVQPSPAPGVAPPITAYTYDVMGRVVTVTDPLGRATQYAYFADGKLRQVLQPDGVTVDSSYTYDSAGNLKTDTDARGETTQFAYNAAGQLTSETDPRGFVTTYTYDMFGNLQEVSRPSGSGMGMTPTTQYTYDSLGRIYTEYRTGEGTTTYSYDAYGQVLTQSHDFGRETQYRYDVLGRLSQVIDPLGKPTDYQYDDLGNLTQVTDRNHNVTQYAYDRLNRRTSVTAPAAGTRNTTYDAVGNVIGQTDALGHETSYGYDRLNRLVSVQDPLGGLTSYTYDAVGNRLTERDPLGNVVSTTYDTFDRPLTIGGYTATPTGDVWSGESYTYDATGNVLTHTDSWGIVDTYEYDESGNVKKHTDAAGKITQYTYDAQGHVLTVTLPAPAANQSAPVYHYEYDPAGRMTKERSPLGNERQWMYNNAGELIFEQVEGTIGTTYEYYADGSLKWRLDQNTDKTQYTYDDMGNLLTVESPLHRITRYTYDAAGRRLSEKDPANGTTQYTYYADGNLHTLTDPAGNVSTFGYDALGRQTSDANVQGTRTFTYDAASHLTQEQDRNRRLRHFDWQFAYNGDGNYRKLDEVWLEATTLAGSASPVLLPKSIITYAYNTAGQLQSITDASSGVAYTYDALGRVASTSESGGTGTPVTTLTNTYDNLARRTGVDTAVGPSALLPLVYGYDADSRLTSIREKLQFNPYYTVDYIAVDLNYRPDGQLNLVTRTSGYFGGGLGAQSQYGYDAAGRLTSIVHMLTGGYGMTYTYAGQQMSVMGALTALSWEYNADGQITASHRGVQVGAWGTQIVNDNRSYTYDPAGQLTGVATSQTYVDGTTASSTQSYGYDPNGNRNTAGYDTDPGNLMVSDGAHTYTYDAEGNRLAMTEIATGAVTLYTWDYRNRLTGITSKDGSGQVLKAITYTYDAFDRRISKTIVDSTGGYPVTVTERYVYDGTDLVLVLNGDGIMQHRFLHGPEVDQVFADESSLDNVLWLLEDNQHSVVNVVATTGAPGAYDHPHWSYQSYDAFGNQTASNPTLPETIAYTGQVWDADAHLYYYKARWYDAVTGKFISSDPLGFAAGDTNLQRYVANDPINARDPSGLREQIDRFQSSHDGVGFYIIYDADGNVIGKVSFRPDWPRDEEIALELAKKIKRKVYLDNLLQDLIDAGDEGAQVAIRLSSDLIDNAASAVEMYYDPSWQNAAGMLPIIPGSLKKISKVKKKANKVEDAADVSKVGKPDECIAPDSGLKVRTNQDVIDPNHPIHDAYTNLPKPAPIKSGLGTARRLSSDELRTGQRLEAKLRRPVKESAHEGAEYVDELGKTYDALGVPNASKYWNEKQFLNSINEHLRKSNDFTVIDLSAFTQAQVDAVRKHLATLTQAQRDRIIPLGFNF